MSAAAPDADAVARGDASLVTGATTGRTGRYVISAGHNHFVSDARASAGGPDEAVKAGELLLGALASCSLGLVQKAAGERAIALPGASVDVSYLRDAEDPTRYSYIRLSFSLPGVAREEALGLIEAFTSRCPIYNTLKRGGPVETELV